MKHGYRVIKYTVRLLLAWPKRIGRQSYSDAVQPQGVTVTELSENISSMHSASNKAKLILHDASVFLYTVYSVSLSVSVPPLHK